MESSEDRSSASGGGGAAVTSSSSLSTTTLKKGPWTSAEDSILVAYVQKHGEGNWNNVQKQSGLFRCGKSCRLRWANHLRPNLKKGAFTPEEERLIIELHAKLGNKWARMATQLPGRTDNEIKNYWNTRIKRRQRAGLPVYPPDIQAAISSSNNNNSLSTSTNTNPTAAGSFYGGFNLLGSKFGSNSEKPTSEFHGFTLQSLQQQGMGTSLALLQASSTGSSSECCAAEETWSASRGFEHHHRQLGLVPHLGTSPLFLQDENELAYEVRPSDTNSFFLTGTPNSTTEIDHHRSVNNNGFFLTATSSSTEIENHHVPSNNNGFFITGTISNNDGGDGNGSFVNTSSGTRSLVIAEHHQDLKLELPSSQLSTESSDSAITTPGSVINSPNRFKENAITSGKNHRSNGLTLLEAYNKLKADHGSEETFSLQSMHLFNLQQHQLRNTVKHEEAMQQQASHYTNGEVMSALLHGDHHPTAGSNTHSTNPTLQDPEWYPHEPMYIMDYHIAPETGKNSRLHIEHYGEAPVGDSTGLVGIVGGQQTSPVLPGSHTQGNNWELSSCCSWNNMPGACQIGDYNPSLGDCRSINCLPEQIIY